MPAPKHTQPGLGSSSHTRQKALSFDDEEEETYPGNQTVVLAQHLMVVFDSMSNREKIQFLALANAFVGITPEKRKIFVEAVERMAGL